MLLKPNGYDYLGKKKIGVCLDEGIAYLLEEKNDENVITIIQTDDSEIKHTHLMKVFEIVQDFDKISLFGSSAAKNELIHRINNNKLLNIEIQNHQSTDKITENQRFDFINSYFNT